jgi:lysophospholipase L1-like esterase
VRILVYGDSNSWGYLDDGSGIRHAERWPVMMAQHLRQAGIAAELVEECLPGRTSNIDDPQEGAWCNGHTPLKAILLSQQPLDQILIMLGTNDMKARFGRDAAAIAAGVMSLLAIIRETAAGPGGWHGETPTPVTVICPPALGELADDPAWLRQGEWRGARATSQALPSILKAACDAAGAGFIDGNLHAVSSTRDPIHWSAETQVAFGGAIAREILNAS